MPLAERFGKAIRRRGQPLIRKPGDLPAPRRPGNFGADGVIRSWCGRLRPAGCFAHLECMMAEAGVELLICLTCKRGVPEDAEAPRPGAVLMGLVADAAVPAGVQVRGVECLSNCNRGCTVALRGAGRWSYIYGDIDPVLHLGPLLEGAAKYRDASDGLIPWRERPEILRKGVIARIPPLEAP